MVVDDLESVLIGSLCLPHLCRAFGCLAADGVGQADLHVERDALQFELVQVVNQAGRRAWVL